MQQRTLTILGGGFSGSMLAMQLARLPGPLPGVVHLVEPRPVPGPGLAYSAPRPEYLLNVRAPFLSAFPDEPTHFTDWLRANDAAPCQEGFCSRQTYGRYLHELVVSLLARPAANGLSFHWHPQAAVAAEIASPGSQATVHLADGTILASDRVVLALGNYPPPSSAGPGTYLTHPRFHGNPWAPGALSDIGPNDEVLLVGSGLTAVDVLLGLRADGHRGPITVVSRHQRWPTVHGPLCTPYPSFYTAELRGLRTVGEVLTIVRQHVQRAIAASQDWRPVFDSIRPDLGAIWAAWPLAEQARFLRHLASIWAVLRHRSPPQNDAAVREMLATGQVRMQPGRVSGIMVDGEDLLVQTHSQGKKNTLRTRHVISCTGPLLDYSRIEDPLVVSLRSVGLLLPDPLRLGIQTDEHGALLNAEQQPSAVLFTLGPSRRPAYFESTAVPELREQAIALAQELGRRW